MFEIAAASRNDTHADLGCGDGRLNFMAVDSPSFGVGKSWGVDVDANILKKCQERLGRRFVPKNNHNDINEDVEERLEFVQADLIKVIESQKELYQRDQQHQQQLGNDHAADATSNNNNDDDDSNNELQSMITHKISNSTIITMYFVDNALQQIQPYLSSVLGGKKNVRVITIGYEMPSKDGWDASWVERVLGLTIFRYDMENVSRFPMDWKDLNHKNDDDDGEEEDEKIGGNRDGSAEKSKSNTTTQIQRLDNDNNNTGDQDVEEFLRRKRQEDMEELNRGLRIHHDEELDEFTHARAKKQQGGGLNASSQSTLVLEDEDDDAWDDFDETEEPEELMKEAQRTMIENRNASRGKLMAGVGERKKKSSNGATSKKPTWKKP